MLEVGVSRDECCATDSENVGWLEGDHYSDSDLFRMSFLTDGGVPNCYTCQREYCVTTIGCLSLQQLYIVIIMTCQREL